MNKTIGLGEKKCWMCGNPSTNRHHVIPTSLNPVQNATIPLCDEHKDVAHPILKQYYLPRKMRQQIGMIHKHLHTAQTQIDNIRRQINFSNKSNSTFVYNAKVRHGT
jgi:hypothetical protein